MLSSVKTLKQMKGVNAGAHWEPRRGTHQQAIDYCSKIETRIDGPWTFGIPPVGAGRRTDLIALKEALDEGRTEFEISRNEELFGVWAKHYKAAERYKRLGTTRTRQWPTFTTVLYGPPGVGKTKYVNEKAGPDAFWLMKPGPNQTVFFDGYEGQEDVVIDEFFGWLPRDLMCRMCDRYPLMVQTKGGAVNFYPKRIWITSNKSPEEWWSNIGLGPMKRRLEGELGKVIFLDVGMDVNAEPVLNQPFFVPPVLVPGQGPVGLVPSVQKMIDDQAGYFGRGSDPAVEPVIDQLADSRTPFAKRVRFAEPDQHAQAVSPFSMVDDECVYSPPHLLPLGMMDDPCGYKNELDFP